MPPSCERAQEPGSKSDLRRRYAASQRRSSPPRVTSQSRPAPACTSLEAWSSHGGDPSGTLGPEIGFAGWLRQLGHLKHLIGWPRVFVALLLRVPLPRAWPVRSHDGAEHGAIAHCDAPRCAHLCAGNRPTVTSARAANMGTVGPGPHRLRRLVPPEKQSLPSEIGPIFVPVE